MLSRDKRNRYYYPGYYPGYLGSAGSVFKHDIKGEARFLKNKYRNDSRIKVDDILLSILDKLK